VSIRYARGTELGVSAQGLADVEAIHLGHHDVEQHEIGLLGTHLGQSLFAVAGHQYLETLPAQQKLDRNDNVLLVVGNQNLLVHQHSAHELTTLTVMTSRAPR
jgi:hypothetical protein